MWKDQSLLEYALTNFGATEVEAFSPLDQARQSFLLDPNSIPLLRHFLEHPKVAPAFKKQLPSLSLAGYISLRVPALEMLRDLVPLSQFSSTLARSFDLLDFSYYHRASISQHHLLVPEISRPIVG